MYLNWQLRKYLEVILTLPKKSLIKTKLFSSKSPLAHYKKLTFYSKCSVRKLLSSKSVKFLRLSYFRFFFFFFIIRCYR